MMEEVFGGRGKWDAARVITVLLAVFSLASWGLELSVDLAYFEGDADLLNRPPPVTVRNVNGTKDWQVNPCTWFVANLLIPTAVVGLISHTHVCVVIRSQC